jgi:hypothetical protein
VTFEPLSHLKNAQMRLDEANKRYQYEQTPPLIDVNNLKGRRKPVVLGSMCFRGPRNLLSKPTNGGSTSRKVATTACTSRLLKLQQVIEDSPLRQASSAATSSRQESPAASFVIPAPPEALVASVTSQSECEDSVLNQAAVESTSNTVER